MYYVRNGVDLDKAELLETLSILAERGNLGPFNLAAIGYLVMNDLDKTDLSLWYFTRSIDTTSANDPFPWQLGKELRAKGRPELADKIEQIGMAKRDLANTSATWDTASPGRPVRVSYQTAHQERAIAS